MLETLLHKIQHAPDFPAFSRTVHEVSVLVADQDQRSINELCAIILRDVALTRKILAVANTFSVRSTTGAVHTVSRAVMMLGFEEVRKIALTLMLFEHLQAQDHAGRLLGRMLQALFGALLAQSLARPMGMGGGEQVFLGALFQHLGPLLVYRHLPEASVAVERLAKDEGLDERAAILRTTGVVVEQLGREVASSWGLPDGLRAGMRVVPIQAALATVPAPQQTSWLASFANAGTAILLGARTAGESAHALEDLARRGGIDPAVLRKAMDETRERMGVYAQVLDTAGQARGVLARLGGHLPVEAPTRAEEQAATEGVGAERLLRGIEDVTASLLEDYTLPQMFSSILETLYQGLDLSLVLLLLHDSRARTLRPSMGFGEHSGKALKSNVLSMDAPHPIATSLLGGEDRLLHRREAMSMRGEPWQWASARADMALILPVFVNRRPVAAFYAEGCEASMTPEAMKAVKTLRNQAALAIMNRSARG